MSSAYDAIIIGGGPAGLFCAANLRGCKTLLIEKMKLPGRKLLITGSGQCNITHGGEIREFAKHYGEHGNFLKPVLAAFSNKDMIDFFTARNVPCIETPAEKVFPKSLAADDILDALLEACDEAGVEFRYEEPVVSVAKTESGFAVKTPFGTFHGKNVVLACGGKSYPKTGSAGDGYAFAESLGHTVTEVKEALTPVYVSNFALADLSGISIPNAGVIVWRGGKKVAGHFGDVLITRFGFSGPGILDPSRFMQAGDILRLNFVQMSPDEFEALLLERCAKEGARQVSNLLYQTGCPERLVKEICESTGIGTITGGQLSAAARKKLVRALTSYEVEIGRLGGFDAAMCTAGGVNLNEINKKTFESKLVPHLFFAGEICDIDGDTGGYNIQSAFSSGFAAAKKIGEYVNAGL
ncbi:MAG TPA: NAD(P)/FAD-dependent oxidoreductase [Methanocorpusculum sp.]|nr:NAD(P)/FAD-dependent oxidoreductase [Methanocorpusculum sp.]